MKNITTIIALFCFTLFSYSQCEYTLEMNDSYGDGWNGNTMDVLVDGTVVLDDVGLASGSTESITFSVTSDADVTAVWNAGGSWGAETSYNILDNDGAIAGSGAQSDIVTGAISAVCPIIECNYSLKMIDSYGDGWNGNTIDVLVDGTVVLDDATLATGSEEIVAFSVIDGSDVTTIWNGGGSWENETSYEIIDPGGAVVGTGALTNIEPGTITGTCPSCAAPSDLIADGVSSTGAVISWTAEDGVTAWEYQLVISGENTAETGTATSDNPLTITGCYANTSYDVYLRTDCGGTYSTWSMVSFTTLCDVITTIPFYEGFNSDSTTENCWTILNVNGDADLWDTNYAVNQFEGDEVAAMYSWFNAGDDDDYLISPGFALTGNERLKFHQRIQSSNYPNNFEVLLSSSGISTDSFTNVLLANETYDNESYVEHIVDLSAYSGDSYIAFRVPPGASGYRLYIDNFIIETIPACVEPTDLSATASSFNDATLTWIGDDSASSYELVIQAAGTGAPTTAGIGVTDTSYEATGLTENTNYEFYVRANCDTNGYSVWSGPFEFYTGYCSDVPATNDADGILSVVLESTTFTSAGDVTYEDFTNPIVDISQAITANLQITFATGYTYGTNVWIDFNGDLVFDNDSELLYQGESTNENPTTLDASFLVPADVAIGTYYMRIGTADSGQATPNPCYSGSYGVTVDMIVNITEPPGCIPPSALSIENITGTSADFSWTGATGNVSWEYVILPTGSPAPTIAGTSTTTTSVQFTNLDYQTTYDVYVISNCGNSEMSTWSGPLTFTTTIQTDYILECGSENININYCYTNNETTSWLFTTDSGFPIEITFNSGTIENFWDNLTIYDGTDNTGAVLFNNNTAGVADFTGLVIESTLTSVFIEVTSDGFGSCDSSTFYTPWDFVVACKTCVTQSATYEVVGVCEPNQEFYVDVDLTDLGSAVNISMTDGVSTQTTQSTGMFTFGPYEANSNIVITLTNSDDESCSINSGDLTFLCPPAPNDCSIVYAGEDTTVCEGTSTNLTAVYHPLGQDTSSYDITTQQGCPTPPLTGGIPTSLDIDDRWSEVIDLGFDFCFFGGIYSQVLIGSNGVLSFELDNADGYNGWNLDAGDALPNASNTTLSDANIYGVAHDIDPSVCGEITYMILGSSPSRQFVVNYSEVCHFGFSCNENKTTSQIILYESSNTIDINIYDKPLCEDWNEGLAVVGVQNIDDTIAFTPPERNTGVWETSDEFWRFTPSLGTNDYVFEWFDGSTLVGTEDTVTVSPTETTTYTASITYNLCTGGTATVTDTVVVEINPNPEPVATSDTVYQCPGDESILEVNVDSDVIDTMTYYWTYDGVDVQSGPDNTYSVPAGQFGNYLVTALDERGCFGETVISVNEATVPELEDGTSFTKCMNEDVELGVNVLNLSLLGDDLEYTWYLNGNEVQSGSSAYYTHTAGQENGLVTVVVTDTESSCESATTIDVGYYMNTNCVDMPQALSPNGDGMNDCLELDHLEDKEDIVKIEIFNRYGVKIFEMNDYMDQWCGQDASDGDGNSNELLPVGTYFYVVQFASGKEPNISWIYLNY